MVQMTALRSLRYGNRKLTAGDTFSATRRDARVLTAVKHALPSDPDEAPGPEPVVEPVVEEAPKRRRRKVVEVEQPDQAAGTWHEANWPKAEPSGHFYERRDMVAEDPQE